MPSPIMINTPSVLGQGLTTLGSTLSSIAQTYADKQKEDRLKQEGLSQATTLGKIIQNADLSSPEGVKTFLSEASKSGIKIDPLQGAKMYQDAAANQIKFDKEKRTKDLYKSLGLGDEEATATPQIMPQGQHQPQQNGQWQGAPFQLPQQEQGIQQNQITPQTQPVQQTQSRRFNDNQVTQMLASGDPAMQKLAQNEMELRKIEQKQNAANRKEYVEERRYHSEQTKPLADEIFKLKSSISKRQLASDMAIDAINSGNVGALSRANLSERLGMPELQSPEGAQLNSAIKEGLISNVGRVSARAQNLYMEKLMLSALPRVGQSKEANLIASEVFNAELQLDKARIQEYDRLVEEDKKKYGYIKSDINERLNKNLEPIEKNILNQTAFKTKQFIEQEQGEEAMRRNVMKKVPKGTYLTPQNMMIMAQRFNGDMEKVVQNAKKMGYKIPTKQELQSWL